MSKIFNVLFCLVCIPASLLFAETGAPEEPGVTPFDGLEWRLVGPYRGGRVTTVTGVPGKPNLYYMGATGGGVWKTENGGATWSNLSDGHFRVGTIGAVAVAESDHNVIYVGTGESPIRGVTTSHGDGVWKSTDAGKTWQHVGLDESGQISRIEIHPQDPDTAYVAVQGQIWGPNEERGVYRTTDGGVNWEQVLAVGDSTGASDLAMDPTNPRVLYAAMWNHGRKPWFIHSGGTDGGLYKSTDGGDRWKKLGGGLPAMVGKIGVDVAASRPERIYAIIEAEPEKGGLWRSDDGGETWALINGHRVLHSRAWYYNHVTADPLDADTVFVLNVPLMKSIDGGETWTKMDTPHGDHHSHWISPVNSRNMISGNDGGATITFDGGETWSSLMNQPTAQFYRVATDNQLPFRIYGGQQDNTTLSIASRSLYGGIGIADYYDVGGGESAHIAFAPDDPRLIYATTINGTLTEYNHETGVERHIVPYPELVYGKDARDLEYRANWNAPVALSPHDPAIIYYGTQVLLQSTDRGATWQAISPDLTRNDPQKQGRNGGPLTPENVGAEFYNTIFYVVESPHEAGQIWVGSDDGLVHLSRDGGDGWDDVSPQHDGEAMINAIEISPHDPATVYLAVTGYKLNDFRPYIYRSTDLGKRWKRIDRGLPEDSFVRVVREDPARRGLLYAGTESGMFFSRDDGESWQPLQLNLPPVPITDLAIRHDTLVAATQGRGFWVLDDLFVVRTGVPEGDSLQVFAPRRSLQFRKRGWGAGDFEAENPAAGVPLYYYLPAGTEGLLTIEILDPDGQVVRRYSSEESDFDRCRLRNMDPRSPIELDFPGLDAGLNKWNWDGRLQPFTCVEDITLFAGYDGPKASPGKYRARISAGGDTREISFELAFHPESDAAPGEIEKWSLRVNETAELLESILVSLEGLRRAQRQIDTLLRDYPNETALQRVGAAALQAIQAWDHRIIQPLHETYEDEDAWETMLAGQVRFLLDVIETTAAPATEGASQRLADLKTEWAALEARLQAIQSDHIDTINDWAKQQGLPYVSRD